MSVQYNKKYPNQAIVKWLIQKKAQRGKIYKIKDYKKLQWHGFYEKMKIISRVMKYEYLILEV